MFLFNLQAVLVGIAVFSMPFALLMLQLSFIFGISLIFIPITLGIGLVALIGASIIECIG